MAGVTPSSEKNEVETSNPSTRLGGSVIVVVPVKGISAAMLLNASDVARSTLSGSVISSVSRPSGGTVALIRANRSACGYGSGLIKDAVHQ